MDINAWQTIKSGHLKTQSGRLERKTSSLVRAFDLVVNKSTTMPNLIKTTLKVKTMIGTWKSILTHSHTTFSLTSTIIVAPLLCRSWSSSIMFFVALFAEYYHFVILTMVLYLFSSFKWYLTLYSIYYYNSYHYYWKWNFPMTLSVCRTVCWWVCRLFGLSWFILNLHFHIPITCYYYKLQLS